MGVVYSGDMN